MSIGELTGAHLSRTDTDVSRRTGETSEQTWLRASQTCRTPQASAAQGVHPGRGRAHRERAPRGRARDGGRRACSVRGRRAGDGQVGRVPGHSRRACAVWPCAGPRRRASALWPRTWGPARGGAGPLSMRAGLLGNDERRGGLGPGLVPGAGAAGASGAGGAAGTVPGSPDPRSPAPPALSWPLSGGPQSGDGVWTR